MFLIQYLSTVTKQNNQASLLAVTDHPKTLKSACKNCVLNEDLGSITLSTITSLLFLFATAVHDDIIQISKR